VPLYDTETHEPGAALKPWWFLARTNPPLAGLLRSTTTRRSCTAAPLVSPHLLDTSARHHWCATQRAEWAERPSRTQLASRLRAAAPERLPAL